LQVISLGYNTGSGLFIGTGKALANGGPGNMILAYLAVCLGVWAHLQTLAETTIAFPTSGNYIDYADRWVDPALAFGARLAEWLGMSRRSMVISPVLIGNQDGRLCLYQKEPFLSF
jgi:amino acid transporter